MRKAKPFDTPGFLATLSLFADMDAAERARVASASVLRRFPAGQILFHEGDPCNEFHVVVTGQVKLFVISLGGAEKVVHLAGPRQNFGEAFMFMNTPYGISAQTLSSTLLLTVRKEAVIREIRHSSDFACRMLAGVSRQVHQLISDVQSYALESGVQRVVRYLLGAHVKRRQLSDDDIIVSLPVNKSVIASRLSLTPEHFSRVLNELERADLIEVDKRDIHIPDAAALSNYRPF